MIAAADKSMAKKRAQSRRGDDPRRPEEKRPDGRGKSHELRFGTRSVESLREDLKTMERLMADLSGALESAAAIGVEELALDGVTKLDRAIALTKSFVSNVKYRVYLHEYDQL